MGDIDAIKKMINRFRWSPFMKSFKQRTVLTAAIWYDQDEIVEEVLGYEYKATGEDDEKKLQMMIKGIDKFKRNPLHYAYKTGN